MQLTFLGTSNAWGSKNRFSSSALLRVGGVPYLIDAGAPIVRLLLSYDLPLDGLGGIFITHNHVDHYVGLIELLNQVNFRKNVFPKIDYSIYVPEYAPYAHILKLLKGEVEESILPIREYVAGPIFDDGNIRVTACKTEHCRLSYGFLVEGEGKRVYFSGDTAKNFTDYPAFLSETGADVTVVEAGHTRLNTSEAISVLGKTKTGHMIFNHYAEELNPPAVIEEFRQTMTERFRVTLACDGDTFEI